MSASSEAPALDRADMVVRAPSSRFKGSCHGFQAVRIDHEPAAKVGRVTPCAPLLVAPGPGARGATRPTLRFVGSHFIRVLLLAAGLAFSADGALAADVTYSNPVIGGDYPDPSVIRVGDDYWATATTSEWAPLFPILHSRDLVNWQHVGNVFPTRPDWAIGSFFTPAPAAADSAAITHSAWRAPKDFSGHGKKIRPTQFSPATCNGNVPATAAS